MAQKKWSTKLTLLLVSSLTIMSVITISPALPAISNAFIDVENSRFLVRLMMTIPALMIAIMAPITGRIIDKKGRLKYLWIALITYALAGSAGFYLDNIYALLASRVILGIAVGVTMTIVITLVADYFDGKERQQFVGIRVAFMSLAGILFIGLGGILADISWRTPFLIYLMALLILPLSLKFLNEPIFEATTLSNRANVKSPSFIWVLFFNTMLMWIIFFLIPVQIPFFLNELGIDKGAMIGAAIALATTFSAVSSFSFFKIKNRFSHNQIFAFGYAIMGLSFLILSFSTGYNLVVLSMIIGGFGMGMMIPNTNMWVMKIAPLEIRGKEIGKLTTFWFLGQFLSPILFAPVLAYISLASTFMVAAIALILLSFTFLILVRKEKIEV